MSDSITYSFSTPLMNDIHSLKAEGQKAIHTAFYKHIKNNGTCASKELLQCYIEDYNLLTPFNENKGCRLLRRATNSLDSLIDEVDYYDPMEFIEIVEVLEPVIKRWKPKR